MNRNMMIIMVGGFLISVLVAMMVQLTLGGGKKKVASSPSVETVMVVVALEDLKAGKEIGEKDVKWQTWPKEALFEGLVKRSDSKQSAYSAASGILRADISKGQPVTSNVLLRANEGGIMAANLAPGKRAFSINVNSASMVSGFVGPGDFVDVILTYEVEVDVDEDENPALDRFVRQNIDEYAAETILQNVKVIAIDQKANRGGDDKAKVGRTVTLEVGLREAEHLALASEIGDLGLALRRLGDEDIVDNSEPLVTDVRMTGIHKDLQARFTELSRARRSDDEEYSMTGMNEMVRVYSGSAVQTVTVAR